MYIYKHSHNLESTIVKHHRANKPVTTVMLIDIQDHTLHCTLRHGVLLLQKHQLKIH